MSIFEKIISLCVNSTNDTETAKHLKEEFNLSKSVDNIRKFVGVVRDTAENNEDLISNKKFEENIHKGTAMLSGKTERPITSMQEAIEFFEVDTEVWDIERYVVNSWDVSMKDNETGGSMKRTNYQVKLWLKVKKENTEKTFQEIIDNLEFKKVPKFKGKRSENVTSEMWNITDVHIGMSAKGGLFDLDWNMKELYRRLDSLISNFNPNSDIIINQLGDFTDGVNGYTARGGHKLQQNLNDREMFKYGLESIVYVIDAAVKNGSKVTLNWLTNSNHPGVTDHNIGEALKQISGYRWENVTVNVIDDFISPVEWNGVTFLLTHGYDERFMKKGLPKNLRPEQAQRIENYIIKKGYENPVLLRGDQHQYCDNQYSGFRDIMTPAFSLPSGWVQTNFMTDYAGGFTRILVDKNGVIETKLFEF